jgi:hypothetical protein
VASERRALFDVQSLAERPYGLHRRGSIQERAEQADIEIGKQRASIDNLVALPAEHMDLDPPIFPEPDFTDTKATVDLELVEATRRPDDLDGEVRKLFALVAADDIALVRLDAALLGCTLERPGAIGGQIDPTDWRDEEFRDFDDFEPQKSTCQ